MRNLNFYSLLIVTMSLVACTPSLIDWNAEATTTAAYILAMQTPIPTPIPDLTSIFESLAQVASGQGMPDAAIYNADDLLLHRLVVFDPSGEPHAWNRKLPSYWMPRSVDETDLVVVVEEREIYLGQQEYIGGPPISRYRYETDFELREARTGQLLEEVTLMGKEPAPFPQRADVDRTRMEGTHIGAQALQQWLTCEVGLGLCPQALRTLTGHTEPVTSVAFSLDGQVLASGSYDHTVRLWRVSDGTLQQTLNGHTEAVGSVAFSPDGQTLASESRENIYIWRISDGVLLQKLELQSNYVTGLAFSPDGQTLAALSDSGTVHLWRVSDGTQLLTLTGHSEGIGSVAFSPDGKVLASGSGDNNVCLWQIADGSLLNTLVGHSHRVGSVAFSPDGQTLASGSYDLTARLWNVSDGTMLVFLTGHTQGGYLHRSVKVTFSADGQILVSGSSDHTIRLWRVSDGALLYTLEGARDGLESVAFSPDGKTLATAGSLDDTIYLWWIE